MGTTLGLEVLGVTGLGEIVRGDSIGLLIVELAELHAGDVVVVTQKIVSKSAKRRLAESEAVRVLRRRGELVVTETRHGFVCASSGVDLSNVAEGHAVLLPVDPDRSARRIRDQIRAATGLEVAVIVSDTFGRAWRRGLTDVAIGSAGIAAILDLRGTVDGSGRTLDVTEVCLVDEIASAAELVMGKAANLPVAIVRGVDPAWLRESSVREEVVRPYGEDLFR
jgi:coenzyme F420-0:L-glutamate ligase/coenzyme F420-1:gamma-L-glutamate ligase